MFIRGLFVIRSNRQTALLPQGLTPYGLKVFSSLASSSREQLTLLAHNRCCGVGCSLWLCPRSSSPMTMSPATAQPPASLAIAFHQAQELLAPFLPPPLYSLFYITLKLLSSCFRSPSAKVSIPSHAGHCSMCFWAISVTLSSLRVLSP